MLSLNVRNFDCLNQDLWSQGLGSLGIKWEVFKVKYKKNKVINVAGH